jgi:hypothetical protein
VDRVFSRQRWSAALVACAASTVASLVQADGRTPDARALGVTEAILDYCTRAYPPSTEKFQFQLARLTQGASPKTLTDVRASDDYRRARAAEEDFVSKVDAHNAKRICARSLAAKK